MATMAFFTWSMTSAHSAEMASGWENIGGRKTYLDLN